MTNPMQAQTMLSDFLANIRVVMVNTTLPANIGSAARAMHTMGLSNLMVVDPKRPVDDDAYAHAAGATAILDQVTIVPTLADAIGDCHWVLAASSRQRHLPKPVLTPRQAANLMLQQFMQLGVAANASETKDNLDTKPTVKLSIALVFGREDRGLTNEELQLADYHVQIPANPDYGVLNVAAAVQVIASVFYEVASEQLSLQESSDSADSSNLQLNLTLRQQWDNPPITQAQHAQLEQRLLTLLASHNLYNAEQSKLMPARLSRLLGRLQLDEKEYQLLQALLAKLLAKL